MFKLTLVSFRALNGCCWSAFVRLPVIDGKVRAPNSCALRRLCGVPDGTSLIAFG